MCETVSATLERTEPVPSPLISVGELNDLIGDPGVKVFDVRGRWGEPAAYDAYLSGHIPGAVFLDWTRYFVEQDVAINLASVSQAVDARASFRAMGINLGDRLVLYDSHHHMFAGRMFWAMRHWGFEDVKVLNGGWKRWSAQGLPVSTEVPEGSSPGSFEPQDHSTSTRLSLERFLVEMDGACVLDGRGARSYAGHQEDPRSGHIPGAINVPYSEVLDPHTGLFLEPEILASRFDAATPGWRKADMVVSCGSGYAGTVLMLALQTLGVSSRLFDGSFSVWKQDPARDVERVPNQHVAATDLL